MEVTGVSHETTDEELVVLTLQHKEHFSVLIERYHDPLLRYIRRLTSRSPDDLSDILQETFIKVYLNLNNFDTKLRFSSWIYRIAHNEVISAYRKDKARPQGNSIDVDDTTLALIADDFDIVAEKDKAILRKHLDDILDTLDPKYRDVLILRFFEEKDYQEISDILKKPMGTIATLLNRAKKKCKVVIESQAQQLL